jgi:polyphosphate kinase 2 (PPK2 family)
MADGHGDGGYDCLCLGCHHLSETEEIFKNVATVIGVYKVADYRQKKLASDSHATPEQKRQAKRSLEEAVEALRDVVDDIDTLPPASKQQLVVLFQDMKSSGKPHIVSAALCVCRLILSLSSPERTVKANATLLRQRL